MRARYENVCIEALGFELPSQAVTSRALEARIAESWARLGFKAGHLEEQTGIHERRFFEVGVTASHVATRAAKKALAAAGREATEIECLIDSSLDREYFEPAAACLVHHALGGAAGALLFDVSNACAGFLNGLTTAANLIELGQIETALVVDGEASGVRSAVDTALHRLEDPTVTEDQVTSTLATLTAGCGAVAAVLTRRQKSRSAHRLRWAVARNASEYSWLSRGEIQATGERVALTHPGAMLRKGVALLKATWDEAVEGFGAEKFEHLFGHQVGLPHATAVLKALEISADKAHLTFPFLGNVGPAGLPLSLALADSEGKLKPGQRLSLLGAGSGLNALILGVDW